MTTFDTWVRRWCVLSKTSGGVAAATFNGKHYVFVNGLPMDYMSFTTIAIKELHPALATPTDVNGAMSKINALGMRVLKNYEEQQAWILKKKIGQWVKQLPTAPEGQKITSCEVFMLLEEQLRKNVTHLPLEAQPQQ